MANVLSALLPILFSTARAVPNEYTAFIGASRRDFNDQGCAVGQTVKVPVVPRVTSSAIPAASMAFTAGGDRTPVTIDFTLNQTAEAKWNLTAEDERLLATSQTAQEMLRQTVEQGWRTLRNGVEVYLGQVAKNNASRAVGTAGTTPFASDSSLLVDGRKILIDNGSSSGRTAIINTAAEANLLKLSEIKNAANIGSDSAIKEGKIGRLYGIDLAASAGVASHTKGTGTSYTSTAAGFAIGTTSIPLITGTGTVLVGDVVSFAGDPNKYGVKTGVAAPGTIVLQEPGLLQALPASATAMTIENSSTDNIIMGANALQLVVRPALQPIGAIAEQQVISDAKTGLSALFLRVVGDGMTTWYMRQVYDAFAPNPYELVKLRG